MKARIWFCPVCNKTYKTESQICPACRRVMILSEGGKKKQLMVEATNG